MSENAATTEPPKRAPRGRPRSVETRRRILIAAAAVIKERGFADVRVSDIAEAAGTSTGLVIYHFKTLDAVLIEALRLSEEEFRKAAERIIGAHDKQRDRFVELVRWVFEPEEDLLGGWALWIETWSQALRHEEIAQARADADEAWRELLKSVWDREGSADADAFAQTVGAILDGFTIQVALNDSAVTPQVAIELTLRVADGIFGW